MAQPDFWDDAQAAQLLIDETNEMKKKVDEFQRLVTQVEDLMVALELLQEEPDAEMQAEFETDFATAQAALRQYRLNLLLNQKYDHNKHIQIHFSNKHQLHLSTNLSNTNKLVRYQNAFSLLLISL